MTVAKETRRKKQIRQTTALVALTESGMSRRDASKLLKIDKERVNELLDDTHLEMVARAHEYADLHLAAARKAAESGKAEPAQWALERLGVVKAPESTPPAGGGTTIKIGIALPGLAPSAGQIITVTPDAVTAREG